MIIKNAMGQILRNFPNKWKIVLLDNNKTEIETFDDEESQHSGSNDYKQLSFIFNNSYPATSEYTEIYYDNTYLYTIEKTIPLVPEIENTINIKVII